MKYIYVIIVLLIPFLGFSQIEILGKEVLINYNTPHPYSGNTESTSKISWTQEINYDGASYIAVHFNEISLTTDDYLVIRDVANTRSWRYTYTEIKNKNNSFWSIPIYGEKVILEIYSKDSRGDYGYNIDKIAAGFSQDEIESTRDTEAICGSDNSENSICYENSEPEVYNKSRAVARLLINGTGACTGWLVGDDGHLITNEHCIGSVSDANNVTIEFMAEGANCSTNCESWFACPGTIEATSTTLIKVNANLDYALLKMNNNVSGKYGFCQLRESGAELNERIYIPQHPAAWGKRIALNSDNINDEDGFARVFSNNVSPCSSVSVNQIGYFADTRGGSSGSPVFGYNDNQVIALHNCANCPNRGVPIENIIADLGSDLPHNAVTNCENTISVFEDVSSGGFDSKSAFSLIRANNTIHSGGSAEYKAGEEVILTAGFRARSGSTLKASIGDCGSESLTSSSSKNLNSEYEIVDIKNSIETVNDLKIYPNPTNGLFNVQGSSKFTSYSFQNISGGQIMSNEVDGSQLNIDISKFTSGIYFLELQTEDGEVFRKKVIKN